AIISIEANGNVNLTITNMLGQVVFSMENINVDGSSAVEVSLEDMTAGIYLVNISNGSVNMSKQLVVSK
ncbi:MAG TPA: T9SS type A sorting domain-containing protein, partial [Chitinophagales bacterium]|nr:T9SS type A sorting domain-containing protein [Chitinophagales bacterium]